jgi:hypothetical protein
MIYPEQIIQANLSYKILYLHLMMTKGAIKSNDLR